MDSSKGFNQVISYIPDKLRNYLQKISDVTAIQEIRLRIGKPLAITTFGKEYFVSDSGGISKEGKSLVIVTKSDVESSFKAICEYSIHSFQNQLIQGYITISGGHRVGICGSSVGKNGSIETIKNISGLNFRVAREVLGSADEIMQRAFGNKLYSLLIIGVPSSGKTTILRDLCRQIGNAHKLSIIDERGEIAATYQGQQQNDVGKCSDVFDGYPKEEGINIAIRVMAPEVIAVDEIGNIQDCLAIEHSIHSGVKIIATAHAADVGELFSRLHIKSLIEQGAFDKIVTLGNDRNIGKIVKIDEVDKDDKIGRNYINNNCNFNGWYDAFKTSSL